MEHCTPHTRAVHTAKYLERKVAGRDNWFQLLQLLPGGFHTCCGWKLTTTVQMEISAEKTRLMTNSASGIPGEIKITGQKLGTVTCFKYLSAVVSDDRSSKPEILSQIAQATAALTKLKPIWRDNTISLGSKVKLMRSLVISIFLCACESLTLTAELKKRTQAFEIRCCRRLLNISHNHHHHRIFD